MSTPLEAIDAIFISRTPSTEDVWRPLPAHADGLHAEVTRRLIRSMAAVQNQESPNAVVIRGERGTGKTHLLTWLRERFQSQGGYFFLVRTRNGSDFWTGAVGDIVDGLSRAGQDGSTQLSGLLAALADRANLGEQVRSAVLGERGLTRIDVDELIAGIRRVDPQVAQAADTIRALALLASSGNESEAGQAYLTDREVDDPSRRAWGLTVRPLTAQWLLRDLTRVIALAGPLVFAFDQLDIVVSLSDESLGSASSRENAAARRLIKNIATGLMDLREEARDTLIVVACQEDTWAKIEKEALKASLDRFDVLPTLDAVPDEATAAAIVGDRLRAAYETVGFVPPYETWPITRSALAEAPHRYSARRLLERVDRHITTCQQTRVPVELTSLKEASAATAPSQLTAGATEMPAGDSQAAIQAALTEMFRKLRDEADDRAPLDPESEDRTMPVLLNAALRSLLRELDARTARFHVQSGAGGQDALHARLVYAPDDPTEPEVHWSFRAVAADQPNAFQKRLRRAMEAAGLEAGQRARRLVLLRNSQYPNGPKSVEMTNDFVDRGGRAYPISAADIRAATALARMLEERPPGLEEWLRSERPASRLEFLEFLLDDLAPHLGETGTAQGRQPATPVIVAASVRATEARETAGGPAAASSSGGPAAAVAAESDIVVGWSTRGDRPFTIPLEQFRKHLLIVGAAGSGKTVLIKRVIEECALRGVSAIVLDPNGDLGRLGDPWPSGSDPLSGTDADSARRYHAGTEVVIWTPGKSAGRPLVFPPIPDFTPVLADNDDFVRLLNSTVYTLASMVGISGTGERAIQQRTILRRALERLARDGAPSIDALVDMLSEPPLGLVNSRTRKLAGPMADTLEGAIGEDPLSAGSGEAANPGMLLTPPSGKTARISVISFVGLSEPTTQQVFVQRLQTALFSWFRANPTRDRPLGGLLVMDEAQEFVPSTGSAQSTRSTVELIRQIRKYGLGMILASQRPKGVDNEAVNNTATQFIGRLTSPVQIEAAGQMAAARGSVLDNLGGLERGTFFAATEGTGYTSIRVPHCLSHHAEPLDEGEVVARARRSG